MTRIEELATKLEPARKIEVLKDASDNKFLELSVAAEADFLITGNTNDFVIDKINGTKIVTPAEYWEIHKPS